MSKKSNDEVKPRNYKTDEPISPELHERVAEKILRSRIHLLQNKDFLFFGMIITRLIPCSADKWLDTMAVDGKYLYYNHRFVDELDAKELLFANGHEVLHIVYDHINRTKDYDLHAKIANFAQDYVINGELADINLGTKPEWILYDEKFKGMTSEEVYDELMKNSKMLTPEMIQSMLDQMLDQHLPANTGDGDGDGEDGKAKDGGNGPAKYSQEEIARIKTDITNEVLNAAKMSNGIGSLPLGVQRMVNQFLNPKMPWRDLLKNECSSLLPYDYNWTLLNRNSWGMQCILPGIETAKSLEVAVFLDMSGSIGQKEATEFLSEVRGIMDAYPSYKVTVGCWDTKVYNVKEFTETDDDLLSYEILGGGGTDPMCIFDYIRDNNIDVKKLLIFTDGYFNIPDNFDGYGLSTIWLINNGDKNPITLPFGVTTYYDD
jgi:predicted metal-dependent peptidase